MNSTVDMADPVEMLKEAFSDIAGAIAHNMDMPVEDKARKILTFAGDYADSIQIQDSDAQMRVVELLKYALADETNDFRRDPGLHEALQRHI